jgi:hypothetical protein
VSSMVASKRSRPPQSGLIVNRARAPGRVCRYDRASDSDALARRPTSTTTSHCPSAAPADRPAAPWPPARARTPPATVPVPVSRAAAGRCARLPRAMFQNAFGVPRSLQTIESASHQPSSGSGTSPRSSSTSA